MSEVGDLGAIAKMSRRMQETGDLLERAIGVVFLAAGLVVIACVVVLIAAFTFAVIHNGDDFDFHHGSRSGDPADIIVLPLHPF